MAKLLIFVMLITLLVPTTAEAATKMAVPKYELRYNESSEGI